MLHMLGQRELSRSLFPVGGMPKAETRAHAERFGLPVAPSPIRRSCASRRGVTRARSSSSRAAAGPRGRGRRCRRSVLGDARRGVRVHGRTAAGLGVSLARARLRASRSTPAANRVVVGPQELLARRGLVADRVSWVAGSRRPAGPFEAEVRIRYRGDDVAAVSSRSRAAGSGWSSACRSAPWRPGQSAVDLPRRRAAGRRAHHRSAPLTPGAGRTLGLSSERPGSYEEVESLVEAAASQDEELRHPGRRTSRCTSPRPMTSPRSRAPQALSFWEQLQSYALRNPEFRRSQAAVAPRAGGRARHRARDGRGVQRARGSGRCSRSAGAVTDQVGRFLAGSLSEVTVSCDGDYFIQTQEADALAVRRHGGAPIAVAVEPVPGGVGVSTTLGRGRGGGGPDGLAVLATSCMLADAAAAGVQAILPKHDGFSWRSDTSSRCPACAAAWSSSATRSAWRAAWRSRSREPVRGARARRGEAPGRGAARADQPPQLPLPRARRPRGRRRRVRRARRASSQALEDRVPGARHAGLADAARRRTRRRTCSRPSRTARRCSRSTTRSRSRSSRRGHARVERRVGDAGAVRVRAEDRRRGVRAHVRARRRSSKAATRGDGRIGRGHHRERPHGSRRAASCC